MPHFSRVLENVKNKEQGNLVTGKQVLVVMPHLLNIKLQVRYKICVWQVGGT
jgi:hypothetical protein